MLMSGPSTELLQKVFEKYDSRFHGKLGLDIFREVEKISEEVFETWDEYDGERSVLGKDEDSVKKVLRAVLCGDWEGIKEYSDVFYKVYDSVSARQLFVRALIRKVLEDVDHGFSDFDTVLIKHSSEISDGYDVYYKKWLQSVRNSDAAQKILEMQKDDESGLLKVIEGKGLDNQYTIIVLEDGEFVHVPYSVFFENEIRPILDAFDKMTSEMDKLDDLSADQKTLIQNLKQYRKCLAVSDFDQLDAEWKKLDEMWMDDKYPIQVVHDIEYAYGDPLKVKVIPDFSLRFADPEYADVNRKIEDIHDLLIKYYEDRGTEVVQKGIGSFKSSKAAAYYIPFQSAMSLQFRFAGQSIPNRTEVRRKKGVKIYFDPVTMRLREKQMKKALEKVFGEKEILDKVDVIPFIIFHLSAHEFGHAIYPLGLMEGILDGVTRSLLEEARADMTAYTAINLARKSGKYSESELKTALFNSMAFDLRRYVLWDSETLEPYRYSAMNAYKIFEKTGYLSLKDDRMILDESKYAEALDALQANFERMLDYIDKMDAESMKKELQEMIKESDLIKWLVSKLFEGK